MKAGKGRRKGGKNAGNEHPRAFICSQFRCTHGFNETIKLLIEGGNYKSKSDVLHVALYELSARKLGAGNYFHDKIL